MWWWLGCSLPIEVALPVVQETPIVAPRFQLVRAETAPVWTLSVQEAHGALSVAVEGGGELRTVARPAAEAHEVVLVGLVPGAEHTLTATVDRPDGRFVFGPLLFETEPVPDAVRLPLEVLAHDPERASPQWLLLAPLAPEGPAQPAVLLDEQLEPRWWLFPGSWLSDLRLGPDGALWSVAGSGVERYAWDGTLLSRYSPHPGPDEIWLDVFRAHHEVLPEPDGSFWTFDVEVVDLDAYPLSYADPTPVPGSYPVEDDPILHVGADGTVLSRWSLLDRLDTSRVGYNSLNLLDEGYDWTHANGLAADGEGGLIVSLRNQDAVVRLDAEGQLDWILGDPLGWSEAFVPHLLAPVGDLSWSYHHHAPEWHPDEHLLVLFDNHTHGATPYGPSPPEPIYSRVVGYEVDAAARTVRQRFAFDQTSTGPLFSLAMGDADLLPNGNLLADFGFLKEEGEGPPFPDQGLGTYGVRIVEFDPDAPDAPALDLRMVSPQQTSPMGFQLYRARKIDPPLQ